MQDTDPYEAWKRRRADIAVPGDFADRVMAALRHREEGPAPRLARAFHRSLSLRLGVCSLACVVGLLRVLQVVALFLFEQSSR